MVVFGNSLLHRSIALIISSVAGFIAPGCVISRRVVSHRSRSARNSCLFVSSTRTAVCDLGTVWGLAANGKRNDAPHPLQPGGDT